MEEKILCAAIWYKELENALYPPKNLDRGIVVTGHRHGNCIDVMVRLAKLRTVTFSLDGVGEHEQGFLTNTNRFVDRKEGMIIAKNANQIIERDKGYTNNSDTLYSEDLY